MKGTPSACCTRNWTSPLNVALLAAMILAASRADQIEDDFENEAVIKQALFVDMDTSEQDLNDRSQSCAVSLLQSAQHRRLAASHAANSGESKALTQVRLHRHSVHQEADGAGQEHSLVGGLSLLQLPADEDANSTMPNNVQRSNISSFASNPNQSRVDTKPRVGVGTNGDPSPLHSRILKEQPADSLVASSAIAATADAASATADAGQWDRDEQHSGTSFVASILHFRHHTCFLLCVLLLVALASVASAVWLRALNRAVAGRSPTHAHVEALPPWPAREVERQLPKLAGPPSFGQPMRLEARVEGPLSGGALRAPVSRKACVAYSAAARQVSDNGDSMGTAPVALGTACQDFSVYLAGAPHVHIEIQGEDVSLFDMCGGSHSETWTFATAPEHLQVFVLDGASDTLPPVCGSNKASSLLHDEGAALEFQERALLIGADVTLVGELRRGPGDTLVMQPWGMSDDSGEATSQCCIAEPWRTSWEMEGCKVPPRAAAPASVRGAPFGKVLVSDAPELLGGASGNVLQRGLVAAWRGAFSLRRGTESSLLAEASIENAGAQLPDSSSSKLPDQVNA